MYKIYTLTCPISNNVFYVGITSKELNNRLYGHIIEKKETDKSKYIKNLISKGYIPIIEEIDNCHDKINGLELEKYWINQLLFYGFKLFNKSNNSYTSKINKNKKTYNIKNNISNIININNITTIKVTYDKIVKQLVENRNASKTTQDIVSGWLKVSRKKLIEFENLKRIDIDLMCEYADIYGIEIKLNFIIT